MNAANRAREERCFAGAQPESAGIEAMLNSQSLRANLKSPVLEHAMSLNLPTVVRFVRIPLVRRAKAECA